MNNLSTVLDPQELSTISNSLDSIRYLSPDQELAVRVAFAEGYNRQNVVLTAFSAAAMFSCFGLWETHPRKTDKSRP